MANFFRVKKGQIYEHYRGNHYVVLAVSRHTETDEWLVTYMALYEPYKVWTRPLEMFCENVQVHGESVPRFDYLHD